MIPRQLPVAIVDAAGASACDAAAIAAGVPSRALMQRAGAAAAEEIARRFGERVAHGVVVAAGPGNNGGDGWVVAHALHAVGVRVRVVECAPARTPDAQAERAQAIAAGVTSSDRLEELASGGESLVVDALLGTGYTADRALDGPIAEAIDRLRGLRDRGAALVALDVPTGLDASTGRSASGLRAALTVTFGTIKRGHLVARDLCGEIVVVDIGLGAHASDAAGRTSLASVSWFAAALPRIAADAHKGTRKKLAIVGGAQGMAGAVVLAARAALRSGTGMVRCIVAPESLPAIQEAEPAALAAAWPAHDAELEALVGWADAILVGPGLGGGAGRDLVLKLLEVWHGPTVLDADALNAFAGKVSTLRSLLAGRPALLTPHPAEFARLAGLGVDAVLDDRFELPGRLASGTGATVLLKGVPTIVATPDGSSRIVAEGTPVLATGGSGDVLGGMAATLLAQTGDAALAGALAAFAHGRAAAAVSANGVRGHTLDDVLLALPSIWSLRADPPRPPVLAELPAVGEQPR